MKVARGAVLPDLERAPSLIAERGGALGTPLRVLFETSSTNDLAKEAARNGAPHGATFVAERQSAGRGRQGREWIATAGESLLVSVLLRVACAPQRLPLLSLASGLAVRDAIARWTSEAPQIKWPNDVLIAGKKVAGILVEGIAAGDRATAVIVGIGINVFQRTFADSIVDRATSIAFFAKSPPDRAELLADLLAALDRDIGFVAARGLGLVHARLTQFDALRGHPVTGDAGTGTAEGIDLEGRLIVRLADGSLSRWQAGEVHLG